MKKCVFVGLLVLLGARVGLAQVAGSAGGFGGNASGSRSEYNYSSDPAQNERNKRQLTYYGYGGNRDEEAATLIEASILMNVKADEYVAVFGVYQEGKTPEEANAKMDAAIAGFKTELRNLGVRDDDLFVDFVTQNRVYSYRIEENKPNNPAQVTTYTAKEELAGFELKKNISIHFKDKLLVDKMVVAASRVQIFDLIKVDYVVKDAAKIQADLQNQTIALLKGKVQRYQNLLGVQLATASQVVADKPSVYFPIDQYDSYTAAESENIVTSYYENRTTNVLKARKSRTTFFNPLSGEGFDLVVHPIIIEPVVQFTTYLKVKYLAPKTRKK